MHLTVKDNATGKIICVKGRRVFAADTTENTMQLLFVCRLSNINQILAVPEGFIIKNTAGKIAGYDRTGRKIWYVSLGSEICTDDDCVYDSATDKIYSFCYSHKTKDIWLYEIDIRTGRQAKKLFSAPQKNDSREIHSYCLLTAKKGDLCYVETVNNTKTDKAVSRIFQGEKIIWEIPYILSGATQICGNKYYNFRLFFDLDARQTISFFEKGFPIPVYNVVNFKNGYCLTVIENGKNKLIFTDILFNKREEKIICSNNFFCANGNVYLFCGQKIKKLNIMI